MNYHHMVLELTPLMIQELSPERVDGCYATIMLGQMKDYPTAIKRWWLEFVYVDSGIIAPSDVWLDPCYLYEAGLHELNHAQGDFIPVWGKVYTLHWCHNHDVIAVPTLQSDVIHQYWFVKIFQRNASLLSTTYIKCTH